MKINVKFCPCNFEDELEVTKGKLREIRDLEVIEETCLLFCGQCLIQPFALVNGENIVVEDPDMLYERIECFVSKIRKEVKNLK